MLGGRRNRGPRISDEGLERWLEVLVYLLPCTGDLVWGQAQRGLFVQSLS
jgi:hypothetical protein